TRRGGQIKTNCFFRNTPPHAIGNEYIKNKRIEICPIERVGGNED
ncbi:MAG: hypothetical protein ACI8PG_005332, partial [Planctomycetota bacterium]